MESLFSGSPHKPGNFGIRRFRRDLYHFSGFGDWALREESVITPVFFPPPQYKRLNKGLPSRSKGFTMFSFFSQVKVKRFLFAVLVFALLAGVLGGCNSELEDDDVTPGILPTGLIGEWSGEWEDGYSIEAANLQYISDYGFGFTGTISQVSNFSDDSGVIIVNYTVPPSYEGYNENPYTAVYYRNLTGASVQLANVTNLSDYSCADTATIEEAAAKFTLNDMADYVDWGFVSPYSKADE